MFCTACGSATTDDDRFCAQCGTELPAPAPTEKAPPSATPNAAGPAPSAPQPAAPDQQPRSRKTLYSVVAILVVAVAALGGVMLSGGDDDNGAAALPPSSSSDLAALVQSEDGVPDGMNAVSGMAGPIGTELLPANADLRLLVEEHGMVDAYGALYRDPDDPHHWTISGAARFETVEQAEAAISTFREQAGDIIAAALAPMATESAPAILAGQAGSLFAQDAGSLAPGCATMDRLETSGDTVLFWVNLSGCLPGDSVTDVALQCPSNMAVGATAQASLVTPVYAEPLDWEADPPTVSWTNSGPLTVTPDTAGRVVSATIAAPAALGEPEVVASVAVEYRSISVVEFQDTYNVHGARVRGTCDIRILDEVEAAPPPSDTAPTPGGVVVVAGPGAYPATSGIAIDAAYDSGSFTAYIDPAVTDWIAFSGADGLVDEPAGVGSDRAPDGIIDIAFPDIDDFLVIVATVNGVDSGPYVIHDRDAVGTPIGDQSVIYGTYPSVWYVSQIDWSTDPATPYTTTGPETGDMTSFIDAQGAGEYRFDVTFVNKWTDWVAHGPLYLLVGTASS